MKKKVIRLTENDLHRIVENSVKRALNEARYEGDDEWRNYSDREFDEEGYQDMSLLSDKDLLDIIGMEQDHIGDDGHDYSNAYSWKEYDNFVDSAKREYEKRHSNGLQEMVDNSVKKVLKEYYGDDADDMEDNEEYDPWINGDASWIDGSYDIPYGFHVEIDSSYSTVAIDDPNGDEENSYFLQGDDADNLIKDICKHWRESNISQEEAVNDIISGYF